MATLTKKGSTSGSKSFSSKSTKARDIDYTPVSSKPASTAKIPADRQAAIDAYNKKLSEYQKAPDKATKEPPSFIDYAMAKFGSDGINKYGKDYVFKAYMKDVLDVKSVDRGDGTTRFLDSEGKEVSANKVIAGRAGTAAAAAGMSNLWSTYMKKGELTSQDYQHAGVAAAQAGAGEYAKDYFRDSVGGNAASSGIIAGLGSAAHQYIDKGEVDWSQAGNSAIDAGGQQLVTKGAENFFGAGASGTGNVAPEGGQSGAAGMAAGVGGAFNLALGAARAKNWQEKNRATGAGAMLGTMGTVAGTVLGGPAAGAVAGAVGKMVGEYRDRPRDEYIYDYDNPEGKAVKYNPQTGQFEASKVTGARRYSVHYGAGQRIKFTDNEPEAYWVEGQQKRNEERAQMLNKRLQNFDKLTPYEQLMMQNIVEGKDDANVAAVIRDVNGNVIDKTTNVDINTGTMLQGIGNIANKGVPGVKEQATKSAGLGLAIQGGPSSTDSHNDNREYAKAVNDFATMIEERKAAGLPITPQQEEYLKQKDVQVYRKEAQYEANKLKDTRGLVVYDPRMGIDKREDFLRNNKLSVESGTASQDVIDKYNEISQTMQGDSMNIPQPGIINGTMQLPQNGQQSPLTGILQQPTPVKQIGFNGNPVAGPPPAPTPGLTPVKSVGISGNPAAGTPPAPQPAAPPKPQNPLAKWLSGTNTSNSEYYD